MVISRRRVLGLGTKAAAVVAAGRFTAAESTLHAEATAHRPFFERLDQFIEQYMREMRAPAMTLVLADREGVQRVASYGFADVERSRSVRPDELFQIGSISKSFVALCLLQLHDEGKLDLHAPIADYLPWFRVDSAFAPITVHHLLTHGSGLPGNGHVFLSDPSQRHRAAHAPGEHFHYNNMAFTLLGYLTWTLDGRELPEVIRRRILEPLAMNQSEPAITLDIRDRLVKSYAAFQNDRPDGRGVRLCEATGIIDTGGAGCIASTARDMGAYIRLIANAGVGPNGRLISKESFALFRHPHIDASEFGPTAKYGYGIAVDELDGNAVVRHTGGMVSFMSAILVDLDEGVGAFASVNAMQDYRPTEVVQFAVQLMRAQRTRRAPAAVTPPSVLPLIGDDAGYAGTYEDDTGRKLVISNDRGVLWLKHETQRVALEAASEPDRFIVPHRDFAHFPLVFGRKNDRDPASAVVEVAWGSQWYAGAAYDGPRQFSHPEQWTNYLGHFRSEDPWIGTVRIVLRKGRLWLDGVIPLEADRDRFYLRDEEHSPEWIAFGEVVNGQCMRLKFSGEDLWRVATV